MNEQELVAKADLALSDLISNGGYLNPDQANRFYRKIIDKPTMINDVRTIRMLRPKMEINKIGFGSRILRAANQGAVGSRALSSSDRAAVQTTKITLTTSEVIAQVNLPYETIEDNIEGGQIDANQFQETVLELMADRVASDLEEILITGDTTSGDPYLALMNGTIKQSVSNIVNQNNAAIDPVLFSNMIKALPTRYHRLLPQFRFYVGTTKEIDYRMQIAQRQTNMGDAVMTGTAPVAVLGVVMKGAAYMPINTAQLLIPNNVIFGIQRDIRMEFFKDIEQRLIKIVVTMRFATQYEEEDMTVKAINLG